ncbi:MAG TPA: zinc ribbon domain-containing protein [Myxococcota bacterium]|nr:zinc ribbon domain-containing protein [Myxococcota bacterium]
MPIYEYRCDKCDREFEVERRITDPPLAACPKCRSRKLRRLISQTSFVLKGGGWYSDLYSSKSSSKSDADKSDADKGGSKETGGDAKDSTASSPPDKSPSKGGEGPGGSGGKKGKPKKPESKSAA